jgi:hypothetical protein
MRVIASYSGLLLILAISIYNLCGCTLCFQNISVHGNATDMADDTQTNTPKVDTTANFSAMPGIPKFPYANGTVGPK